MDEIKDINIKWVLSVSTKLDTEEKLWCSMPIFQFIDDCKKDWEWILTHIDKEWNFMIVDWLVRDSILYIIYRPD